MATKVLVVDDSFFMRKVLSDIINSDPELEVVGTASDGLSAVREVKKLNPDVITLDIQMPLMDGLSALNDIMSTHPTPVLVLSAFTKEQADVTLQCLEAGAVDFMSKPGGTVSSNIKDVKVDLIKKIKLAAKANVQKTVKAEASSKAKLKKDVKGREAAEKIVAIVSSTGGPSALAHLFPHFPVDFDASILMVQHMPSIFTASLATRLDASSALLVKEGESGERIVQGAAYIAPGGFHMFADKQRRILINDEPQVMGLRPYGNYLLESVAKEYGKNVLAVILTGMGDDGTKGAQAVKKAGGRVIAQDEETSVVFGMPKSVLEKGITDEMLPIGEIANAIIDWI